MTKRLMPAGATTFAVVCLVALTARAGPTWCEFSDAGSLPHSAQVPLGTAALDVIDGALTGLEAASDFEDVYLIFIEDPTTFRVTTDPDDPVLIGLGPGASFNTQLWLFRPDPMAAADALGMLGNDDTPDSLVPGVPFSLLTPVPDDGEPPLMECGLYYLAISGADNVPVSVGGEIFDLDALTEISGPDGRGGADFHSGWLTGAMPGVGTYTIALASVRFPSPCLTDCSGDGTVDVVDLLALLSTWGDILPCSCDFDGGGVGVTDLLALLAEWGCAGM